MANDQDWMRLRIHVRNTTEQLHQAILYAEAVDAEDSKTLRACFERIHTIWRKLTANED